MHCPNCKKSLNNKEIFKYEFSRRFFCPQCRVNSSRDILVGFGIFLLLIILWKVIASFLLWAGFPSLLAYVFGVLIALIFGFLIDKYFVKLKVIVG